MDSLVTKREREETQSGSVSSGTVKVNGIYEFKKVLKVLNWVFGHMSVECTSVLHQPDGVGSQVGYIGSYGKLNGVLVTFVAWLGILS